MIPLSPTRRAFLKLTAAASNAAGLQANSCQTRSFWLFKLLQPRYVLIHPVDNARLHCSDADHQWIVEGNRPLRITTDTRFTRITGADGTPVPCTLEISGALRRTFVGLFAFPENADYVQPVVEMDCETAASAIVAAELPVSSARFHALAAQAVVSRSVILGTDAPQHRIADFCDTTHCQFLRSPAPRNSTTSLAVDATNGYVLTNADRIIPARYSAACGGKTQSGLKNGHRYISVRCEVCTAKGNARRGHGWGLCQEGAMELAKRGWTWRAILMAYYPNASLWNVSEYRD